METNPLEPIRWQEDPARIMVRADASDYRVYYQVTAPSTAEAVCCGRPVEELPRILPLLGPAHHLTAALALDRAFGVTPPELAQNMRTALLQAQYGSAHLRKIFFLMTSRQDPFADFRSTGRGTPRPAPSRRILENIMRHAALAQEAETILGGRADHPLTAVAGGVSRYLKEGHYERLAEIAEALLPFTRELAAFMREEVLSGDGLLSPWADLDIPALAGLHLPPGDARPTLTDPGDGGAREMTPETMGEIIAFQREPWTHQPFAYLKEKGWPGLSPAPGLFYVGPLARFNAGEAAATPLAEEERQRMIECLGTPPVHTLGAAFGALAVELVQGAEMMNDLCRPEKLTGPSLRAIPEGAAASTWAALEAPQGLTWHGYTVGDAGIVQDVTVIDARAANNALKCLLAGQVVASALEKKEAPAAIKEKVAVALLPF